MQNETDLMKVVDKYLEQNKNIEVTDYKGRNILMVAVKKNYLKLFDKLQQNGFDNFHKDRNN